MFGYGVRQPLIREVDDAGPRVSIQVRAGIDLDRLCKRVAAVGAQMSVESVVPACPGVLGIVPILLTELLRPPLAGQVDRY